jgi:hypothetical protein
MGGFPVPVPVAPPLLCLKYMHKLNPHRINKVVLIFYNAFQNGTKQSPQGSNFRLPEMSKLFTPSKTVVREANMHLEV